MDGCEVCANCRHWRPKPQHGDCGGDCQVPIRDCPDEATAMQHRRYAGRRVSADWVCADHEREEAR